MSGIIIFKSNIYILVLIFLVYFLIFPLSTHAETFNVTNEDELREALGIAESNGEDDLIDIAAGLYSTLGETFKYKDTGGDRAGLTIQGDGKGLTILDGSAMSRVLEITSPSDSPTIITIKGLTIQNGFSYFMDEDNTSQDGAGIFVQSQTTIVEDCEFIANKADIENGAGGGVYINSIDISLVNNSFNNNSALYGGGAGIVGSNIELTSNSFVDNMSSGSAGGVFLNGTNLIIANNKFLNNIAVFGGGVYARGATTSLNNNEFSNNNSEASGGGLSVDSSNLLLLDNRFTGNSARLDGGGAEIASYVESQISGNIFTDNSVYLLPTEPDIGGGGLSIFIGDQDVILTNNIFTLNTSTGNGGALDVSYYDDFINQPVVQDLLASQPRTTQIPPNTPEDNLVLTNNTFTLNSAALNGGAINIIDSTPNDDTANIYNNIIYDNVAEGDGDDLYIKGGLDNTSISFEINLFNNDFSSQFISCGNQLSCLPGQNEGNNIDENPLFVNAAEGNVGLQPDSPCIDTGDPNAPDVPGTDIYGNPRGPIPDMGAIEYIAQAANNGGCSLSGAPATSSLAVFFVVPVLIIMRRLIK